jgi:hypothetical protein
MTNFSSGTAQSEKKHDGGKRAALCSITFIVNPFFDYEQTFDGTAFKTRGKKLLIVQG